MVDAVVCMGATVIRIGRIFCWEDGDRSRPYFRLVVENGKLVLGCWRSLGYEPQTLGVNWLNRRVMFERIS